MTDWQPFETAPKDRKFICLFGGQESVCLWDKDRKVFALETAQRYVRGDKPKWKPLPKEEQK